MTNTLSCQDARRLATAHLAHNLGFADYVVTEDDIYLATGNIREIAMDAWSILSRVTREVAWRLRNSAGSFDLQALVLDLQATCDTILEVQEIADHDEYEAAQLLKKMAMSLRQARLMVGCLRHSLPDHRKDLLRVHELLRDAQGELSPLARHLS